MSETTAALGAPRRYGRYAVVKSLGGGAMGDVFLARDTLLARDVALKVMRPVGLDLATFRARFEAEARALASLQHPSAVQVFDLGWEGDEPYLVMELVAGGTLKGALDGGPLGADEVRSVGVQVANALAAAHARGILHRDVKPANILGQPGRWKLADFGIAHVPGSELTMTGQFLGTPAFAAPESLAAGEFSPASDVYGLGATLYAALTGEPPYGGHLGALTSSTLPPIEARAPAAPPALADAITRALDRDPSQRPSASALASLLASGGRAATPTPVPVAAVALPAPSTAAPDRRRPPWLALAGAAAAIALVIGLVARHGGDEPPRGGFAPAFPAGPATPSFDEPGGPIALPPQTHPRHPKLEKKWRDALKKAERGELDEAAGKAAQILRDDPDDVQARALLEELIRRGARPEDD